MRLNGEVLQVPHRVERPFADPQQPRQRCRERHRIAAAGSMFHVKGNMGQEWHADLFRNRNKGLHLFLQTRQLGFSVQFFDMRQARGEFFHGAADGVFGAALAQLGIDLAQSVGIDTDLLFQL